MVTAMRTIDFLFDFGSPNAYLCHRAIPAIEQRTGTTFVYEPILLGGLFKATGNKSPIETFAGVKNKLAFAQLEIERFRERHAIDRYRMNPHFPVNTLIVMRGAVAAQRQGVFAPYVEAMFRAMWEDGRKMDDLAEVRATLDEAGLPAEELMAAAQSAEVKQALVDATASAVARGAFGAPTFFVDGAMYFGKDQLWQVEEAVAAA